MATFQKRELLLPVPVNFDADDPSTSLPASSWETVDGVSHDTLGDAFDCWSGMMADGSGQITIGEEVGRLLISWTTHDKGSGHWDAVVADMRYGPEFTEVILKIADAAGLFDVQFSIYSAGLSDLGRKWADLFTWDAKTTHEI